MRLKIYLSIITVFTFLFCLSAALENGITSDAASMYREALDIANGNWLLHGWTLSTVPFYFTDTIWYAMLIKLIGNHQLTMWVAPVIVYTIIVTISSYLIYEKNKNYVGALALLICVAMPSNFASQLTLAMCIHVGTLLISILSIAIIGKKRICIYFLVFVMSSLSIFSDPMFLYIFSIPLISACLFECRKKYNHHHIIIITFVVSSVIMAKLLSHVAISYDFLVTPGTTTPKFVEFDRIGFNLGLIAIGCISYFDAFIFGRDISIETIPFIIRFIMMISWYVLLTYSSIKLFGKSMLDTYLVISTILLPLAYLLSNMPVDIATTRYLVYSFITGSIIIGRFISSCDFKIHHIIICIVVIFSANIRAIEYKKPNDEVNKISDFIKSKSLGDGYGTFWVASSVSVRSGYSIAPIKFDNEKPVPMKWLSKLEWYDIKSRYIVLSDKSDISKIIKYFGKDGAVDKISESYIVYYPDDRITF